MKTCQCPIGRYAQPHGCGRTFEAEPGQEVTCPHCGTPHTAHAPAFIAGNGRYQVGDRLRYVGKPPRFLQDVAIGTEATITRDFGFDYRYMLEFEPTRVHLGTAFEREDTRLRTNGYGWEPIETGEEAHGTRTDAEAARTS